MGHMEWACVHGVVSEGAPWAAQLGEPRVAKHLVQIMDEDLLTQFVEFECNTGIPGSHPSALWSPGARGRMTRHYFYLHMCVVCRVLCHVADGKAIAGVARGASLR